MLSSPQTTDMGRRDKAAKYNIPIKQSQSGSQTIGKTDPEFLSNEWVDLWIPINQTIKCYSINHFII